ncbi:MAG: hypothetical protein C0504_05955 [Candidatus Solibacter sp.]|nr:hypothetical protein [Candidatus Solibacter sp.]
MAAKTHFAKQVEGEKPLSQATASRLCRLAAEIGRIRPWGRLREEQLIAVERSRRQEVDFVSVMGSLGEHEAIHVYPGAAGYSWYQDVCAAEDATDLLLAECDSIRVAFPDPDELTGLDLDLIHSCRIPGLHKPFHFRSTRRGYYPWYINQEEGLRLARCLESLIAFFSSGALERVGDRLWDDEKKQAPLLYKGAQGWMGTMLCMAIIKVNPPRLWLSDEEFAALPSGRKPGAMCLGGRVMPGVIGDGSKRPIVAYVVVALDVRSERAYRPVLREPGRPLVEAAAEALAAAIKESGSVPERLLVADGRIALGLSHLAGSLGIEIRLKSRLPLLDKFFGGLDKSMRPPVEDDPGRVH